METIKHGTSRGYKHYKCRCQLCRDEVARLERERRARYKEKHGVPYKAKRKSRGYEKVCANPACGATFYNVDKRKTVCGDACSRGKKKYDRLSRLAPVLYDEALAMQQRTVRVVPVVIIKGSGGVWYVGDCAWCGEAFTRISWADPVQCCSRKCSDRRWRHSNPDTKRSDRFWISDRRRFALYERDNYVCQICYANCSETYSFDDPLSPTLDHVVPKSRWEECEYLHDDFNLRTACAGCNSSRLVAWSGAEWLSLMVLAEDVSVEDARSVRAAL